MRRKIADDMANSAEHEQTRFCIVFGNNCHKIKIFNVMIKKLANLDEGNLTQRQGQLFEQYLSIIFRL